MKTFSIVLIALAALAAIGFGVYYYFTRMNKPKGEEYIWLGAPEDHPFKKKKVIKVKVREDDR